MLKPIFDLNFGIFPIYRLMMCVGFFAGVLVLNSNLKQQGASKFISRRVRGSFLWASLLGLLGANLANWFLFPNTLALSVYHRLTQGGCSFLFGLPVFLGAAALFLRLHRISVREGMRLIVPSILIAHFFGRLGCSLRGCCWGKMLVFGELSLMFPARELEAVFLLVMFFVLSKKAYFKRLPVYLFSYGVFRFVLEFFRGDDRGSLFGMSFLSPSQFVCLVLILCAGTALFLRPVMRLLHREQLVDELKMKIFCRGTYTPRPLFYTEEKKRKSPLVWIVAAVLIPALLAGIFVIWNPLRIEAFAQFRFSVEELFSGLFAEQGTRGVTGDTNGATVLKLPDTTVSTEEEALTLIEGQDDWAGAEWMLLRTKTLANGNTLRVFSQCVEGKPILGKTRTMVSNAEGRILYVIGDGAALTLNRTQLRSCVTDTVTFTESLAPISMVLEELSCWYDSGRGLVEARHKILTSDGVTPVMGVIVQAYDDRIIGFTDPVAGVLSSRQGSRLCDATEQVLRQLRGEGSGMPVMHARSAVAGIKIDISKEADAILDSIKDYPREVQVEILQSAKDTLENSSQVDNGVYGQIMEEEIRNNALQSGASEAEADEAADRVGDILDQEGFAPGEDEAACELHVGERAAIFRFTVHAAGDTDAVKLISDTGYAVRVTVKTASPLYVSLFNKGGEQLGEVYVDQDEELLFFPEDGQEFLLQIRDREASFRDPYAYSITVRGDKEAEEPVPIGITMAMRTVESSYNSSNLLPFCMMYAPEGVPVSLEETLTAALLAPAVDSCRSCINDDTTDDTVKDGLLGLLLATPLTEGESRWLRESRMEMSCLRFIKTENGYAVKARVRVSLNGMYLCDTYSYFYLERIEREELSADGKVPEGLAELFENQLYITDLNTPELYAMFGDSEGNFGSGSELPSLYKLLVRDPVMVEELYIDQVELDVERARQAGHSEEKIKAFQLYSLRLNLSVLKEARDDVKAQRDWHSTVAGAQSLYELYDALTDPIGTVAEHYMSQNEITRIIYKLHELKEDAAGTILSDAAEAVAEDARAEVQRLDKILAMLDAYIAQEEQELEAGKKSLSGE